MSSRPVSASPAIVSAVAYAMYSPRSNTHPNEYSSVARYPSIVPSARTPNAARIAGGIDST
jgi:hypothetical protein